MHQQADAHDPAAARLSTKSTGSLRGSKRWRKTLKGKDRDSDTPEDEVDLLSGGAVGPDAGPSGLTTPADERSLLNEGETNGVFDAGWKGGQDDADAQKARLGVSLIFLL